MDAIILAAGNSSRFGDNKLLFPIRQKPMYRHITEHLYRLKKKKMLEHIILVTQYEEILADVRSAFPELTAVYNPTPEQGISGSIQLGILCLRQINPDSEACLFTVADQPFLTEASVQTLLRIRQARGTGIAAASNGGQIGNPVIFSSAYYDELMQLHGDVGGKKVLLRHLDDTALCPVPDEELKDIDTPESAVHLMTDSCEQNDRLLESCFPFLKEKGHVISIVGAGGKTTLLETLANYCVRNKKTAVVTTSTHIYKPQCYPLAKTRDDLLRLLSENGVAAVGEEHTDGKLTASKTLTVNDCQCAADFVLIEADGAKHFPCKVPADTEPVIPEQSDIVLGVAGIDAIGKPLEEVCFRKEHAVRLLKTDLRHRITEYDLAYILASPMGTRKDVKNRDYYVVLNKCDRAAQRLQAEAVRKQLNAMGICRVVCVCLRQFIEKEGTGQHAR